MPKKLNALTSDYVEITIPPQESVKICPFTENLLAELTAAFERRQGSGKWCGFAALDTLPEELSVSANGAPSELHPLCTVMFLKGADSRNFLLQSIDQDFLLLDDNFHLVHKCPSLTNILDQTDYPKPCP